MNTTSATPGQLMTPLTPPTIAIDTTALSYYQIIAFVVIFIIFASIVYYTRDFFLSEWKKLYPVNELTGVPTIQEQSQSMGQIQSQTDKSQPASIDYGTLMGASEPSKADPVLEGAASSVQTWCLVGEDYAGRWCIQVPTPQNCEEMRTYKTKNQCEKSSGGT